MAFTTTSKYVQLTPYLVLEYMYADQPNPETYNVNSGNPTVSFNKLINGILEYKGSPMNDVQIYNWDENYSVTQNTSLDSVVQVSENSFISLNPNLIVPYNDFNPKLTPTADLPIVFPSNISVVYDSVRYHILQGYNLENIDGLVLSIAYLGQDGSYVTFSQVQLSSGNAQNYTLNPVPLTIGSNIYNKYFEIKIPSFVDMNNQFSVASAQNKPNTLAGKTSKNGQGYVNGAPMRINVWQILDTTQVNGYNKLGSNLYATLSLETEDPFKNVGAYIAPADTGDFFEYFATDDGGFIENFILFQNSIGNQYYIDHKIETIEQIGAALLITDNFSTLQTTAYDLPLLYRPIVRNSALASSFTLRYTMTLVNSLNQTRLVRIATYTSNDPAKYGTYIAPLQLSIYPQTQKIYNKLATQSNIAVPANTIAPQEIIKYQNVFFERNLVNTTLTNLVVKGNIITQADAGATDGLAYGLGQAYVTILPFDNYYKFTFFKKNPDGTTDLIDLTSSGTFKLVFIDNQNNKLFAPSISDKNLANSARGELAFKLDQSLATQVLTFSNRRFYISNQPIQAETNTVLGQNAVPKLTGIKNKLAKKSLALGNSISDIQLAATEVVNANTNLGTARISANSASVLYYGNWLKDGEPLPTPGITGQNVVQDSILLQKNPQISIGGSNPNESASVVQNSKSSWQNFAPAAGTDSSTTTSSNTGGQNTTGSSNSLSVLGLAAFKSAIASDVQGKISLGWTTAEIIDYFLNPGAAGFQIYSGITKQIFTDAVTGIFNNFDLALLNEYGNTGGGRTNGGPASGGGSTTNQSGQDSGSSSPAFPPSSGGSPRPRPDRGLGTL